MSDTNDIRGQIIQSYRRTEQELTALRESKTQLASKIALLVDELKEQRRLVRVVAPELLNGDQPDE